MKEQQQCMHQKEERHQRPQASNKPWDTYDFTRRRGLTNVRAQQKEAGKLVPRKKCRILFLTLVDLLFFLGGGGEKVSTIFCF